MTEQQAWDKLFEKEPLHHINRCVYADWLDEQGRHNEADRQRKYVDAFKFLADFTSAYRYSDDTDEDGEPIPGTKKYDYRSIMEEVNYWAEEAKKDDDSSLCFSTNYAQDQLDNRETRQKFWEAVYVVTGVMATDAIKEVEWYQCAC